MKQMMLIGAAGFFGAYLFILSAVSMAFLASRLEGSETIDCATRRRFDYLFPVKPIVCFLSESVE